MISGTKPTKVDHRDRDYFKNRKVLFGATAIPEFPKFYNADQLGWLPNQNFAETDPIAHTAQPVGCTNFTQASLANNLVGQIKFNPDDLEVVTHANASGGADVRTSLLAARKLGWIPAFYNVNGHNDGNLDGFDHMRLALVEGIAERRTISAGTPWHASFESVGPDGIITKIEGSFSWHDHEICGMIEINGVPKLIDKSWQGKEYGDKGLVYFDRSQINQLFSINGSVAYIAARNIDDPARITLPWFQYVLSVIRQFGKSWLPYSYGSTTMLWDTPAHCRRNVRVMCDNSGLTFAQKVIICACVSVESGFMNYYPSGIPVTNKNLNKDGTLSSTDHGIVQVNDRFHIGTGKDFPSVEYVMANPEKMVQWMIDSYKGGRLSMWSSYLYGAYRSKLVAESRPSIPY